MSFARIFALMLVAGGLIETRKIGQVTRQFWARHGNALWRSDPERIAAAEAKRTRRAAILRENVARGAYGLTPNVGQRYMGNTFFNRSQIAMLMAVGPNP